MGTKVFNIAGIAALLLVMAKCIAVISFQTPMHVVTSGFEEESLFALWKWVHNEAIYTDPHAIPYTASYFNWLFYTVYGTLIKTIITVGGLSDEWIPTIGRLMTLTVCIAGMTVTKQLLNNKSTSLGLSILLWLGPLMGFWVLTVRPDPLGLFFDVCAAAIFLRYYSSRLYLAIFLAAFACYLSWSCKQINVVMTGAIGLFLLSERHIKAAFCFGALMCLAYGLTFYFAPQAMLDSLFFVNTDVPLAWATFTENLISFIKKALPVGVLLAGLITIKSACNNKLSRLGWCGLVVWSVTLLPASSKIGSADNYHFIALLFIIFIVDAKLLTAFENKSRYTNGLLTAAAGVYLLILAGATWNGSLQGIAHQHQNNLAIRECVMQSTPPVFVIHHYNALPWMNPHSPPILLAYNYWFDRKKEIAFEKNGVGGLTEKGYFGTLILPALTSDSFDGGLLTHYDKQTQACAGWSVYKRKETS